MKSRNVFFFEDVFPCRSKNEASSSKQTLETIDGNSQDQKSKEEVEIEPRHSKKERTKNLLVQTF